MPGKLESWSVDQTWSFRGSKSRNKVSVGGSSPQDTDTAGVYLAEKKATIHQAGTKAIRPRYILVYVPKSAETSR
jgi:hypothetical protein